jgi:hypothetical protein
MGIQGTAYNVLSSYSHFQNQKQCTSASVSENNIMKDYFSELETVQHGIL